MPGTVKKELIIQNIQNNFHDSKAVIFYNFHQSENREIFHLKKELKNAGGHWKVYKNSLIEKALPNYPLQLWQANALIFCREDEYKPLNILARFNKEKRGLKRFHGGIYEQKLINSSLLEKWANLPSKEILINTLCYYLSFQVRRLANVLEKIKLAKK